VVSEIPRSEGAARGLRYNKRMWIYSGLFVVRAVLSKIFCGAIVLKLAHHWGGGDDPVTASHVLFSSSQYQFSLTNSATTQTSTHGSEVKGNTRKKKRVPSCFRGQASTKPSDLSFFVRLLSSPQDGAAVVVRDCRLLSSECSNYDGLIPWIWRATYQKVISKSRKRNIE